MAVTRAQVSGLGALALWLRENATAFFSEVVTEDLSVFGAWDNEGNKVFQFASTWIKAFRANNSAAVSTGDRITNIGTDVVEIIACDNGIIIDTSGHNPDGSGQSVRVGILITKTNNDKVAIVFSCGEAAMRSTNYLHLNLRHVALGDSTTTSTTTTFMPEAGMQTALVPFATNANIGEVSYTPNAFWIAMNPNYGMGIGKFIMGGDTFITNGYWAVRDNA